MTANSELAAWQRLWQRESAVPADLRARVERQSRWMRIQVAGEILVTLLMGGATTGWAILSWQADVAVLAAATWVFLAAAWGFSVLSRRRCWSPVALTTAAFVDLSIRRCRGSIAVTTFGAVLYFAELLFCLAWVYRYSGRQRFLTLGAFLGSDRVLAVWACTVLFLSVLYWYRRRKQRELRELLALQEESR
jgi:hypothetical protein